MATDIDICNVALSHLGDEATITTIDPPEGSAQAEHCATYYPIARKAVLSHPRASWSFATRRAYLALLTDTIEPWGYVYSVPSSYLRIIEVLDDGGTTPQAYEKETLSDGTEVILTNVEDAQTRYIVDVTDPAKFTPLCELVISYWLASLVAGPLLKGKEGMAASEKMLQMAIALLGTASQNDANQRRVDRSTHKPSWISNR